MMAFGLTFGGKARSPPPLIFGHLLRVQDLIWMVEAEEEGECYCFVQTFLNG
jgi:hypothetical protein